MESEEQATMIELRLSYRYIKEQPWVVTAVNGFLSAYFMEQPSFRVQRHFEELESGMHVWVCEVPSTMKMTTLLRRLQADIPPCRYSQTTTRFLAAVFAGLGLDKKQRPAQLATVAHSQEIGPLFQAALYLGLRA